jgi:hypothetical protein
MASPWRDIYPIEFWEEMVGKYRSGTLTSQSFNTRRKLRSWLTGDRTGRKLPKDIEQITAILKAYHSIQKDELKGFKARIMHLKDIQTHSNAYVTKYKINQAVKGEKSPRKVGEEHLDTYTSMDAYVWSIGRRAGRKAGYLEEIQNFCQTSEYSDPKKMLDYLTDTRHVVDNFQHLSAGCRLESLDPYHRAFELDIREDGFICGRNNFDHEFPLQVAFGEWIGLFDSKATYKGMNARDIQAPMKPFFVWLEAHPMTLGQRWGGGQVGRFNVKDTKSIKYFGTKTDDGLKKKWRYWLVASSTGVVCELDLQSMQLQPFNTQDGYAKEGDEPYKTYAFVWAEDGGFFAAKHEAGNVHHSSLVAGGRLRSAGMIDVDHFGKVKFVSNNSGHYKPTKTQTLAFVQWLNERGVMSHDAKVRAHPEKVVELQAFLKGDGAPVQVSPPVAGVAKANPPGFVPKIMKASSRPKSV